MTSINRTARCCCEDAAITVSADPVLNAVCHCASCRRRTGSAFGWNAYFADAAIVETQGAVACYARPDREPPFERYFCARCGTTLFWRSSAFMVGYTGISAGAFATDPLPEPQLSARDDARCAWLRLPEDWLKTP